MKKLKPRQVRPALEALEDRLVPAPAPVAAPGVFITLVAPTGGPAAPGGQLFLSPPAALDPLMTGIGRLPQSTLSFPASGGGDTAVFPDLASLLPSLLPADSAPADTAAAVEEPVWYS